MSRFWRINTIWRKELIDVLRDRRTVVAMVLVPMVLYPALMLGSLQAVELQVGTLVKEEYTIGVESEAAQTWLRNLVDTDPARSDASDGATAEEIVEQADNPRPQTASRPSQQVGRDRGMESARSGVRAAPPSYEVVVLQDVAKAVRDGLVHAGVLLKSQPPLRGEVGSAQVLLIYDESEIRSEIAASGIQGVFERANAAEVSARLRRLKLAPEFIRPLDFQSVNIASAEKMAGSVLGQIVPLILIIMTITGSIYPAIDLTAGERERGTLETLMASPVPPVDLITGKFIVVTLVGLISAVLNLASIGLTIYFGGVGQALLRGSEFIFPLSALPLMLILLVPLALMFSALLLAVCSFARSFKEAQNYILPVMVAALIPGIVGILPGTRLEGPIVIIPVANIVVLTRELFMGNFNIESIAWVGLSTSLYAVAAVAIAARLFGQEAVMFADAASIKTIFQRRFFKKRMAPSAAQALLLLTLIYSLNFYVQQGLAKAGFIDGPRFLYAIGATLLVLLVGLPLASAAYTRVDIPKAFRLQLPSAGGWLAAILFGASTWVLVLFWLEWQQTWLPIDPKVVEALKAQFSWYAQVPPPLLLVFLAVIPAIAEELFFRGYVLRGLQEGIGAAGALLLAGLAFGLFHYTVHRLLPTAVLGMLLGLLVMRYGSVWPAVLAHLMHNGISALAQTDMAFRGLLERVGMPANTEALPPAWWALVAGALSLVAITMCLRGSPVFRSQRPDRAAEIRTNSAEPA